MGLLIAGFLAIFVVFDRAGAALRSGRGERGWILCALVVALAWSLEVVLYRRPAGEAFRALGLRFGSPRAVLGAPVPLRGDWLTVLPGLFAQHGVAEEVLFRGFPFIICGRALLLLPWEARRYPFVHARVSEGPGERSSPFGRAASRCVSRFPSERKLRLRRPEPAKGEA
ncbi:MAG: hypothetical protein ABR576_11650 [Thermoanaerobaculia bacterium]